jgi:hypothetical protein
LTADDATAIDEQAQRSFGLAGAGLLAVQVGIATFPVALVAMVAIKLTSGLLMLPFALLLLLLIPVLVIGTFGGEVLCLLAPTRRSGRLCVAGALLLQTVAFALVVMRAFDGDREIPRGLAAIATAAWFGYLANLAAELQFADAAAAVRRATGCLMVAGGGIYGAKAVGEQSLFFSVILGVALGCAILGLWSYWRSLTHLRSAIRSRS